MAMYIDVIGKKRVPVPGIGSMTPINRFLANESIVRNLVANKDWTVYCSITNRLITVTNVDEFMQDQCCSQETDIDSSRNCSNDPIMAIDIIGDSNKIIPNIPGAYKSLNNYMATEAEIRELVVMKDWRIYSSSSKRLITPMNVDEVLGTKCTLSTEIKSVVDGELTEYAKLSGASFSGVVRSTQTDSSLTINQFRNIVASTTDLEDGVSALTTGNIYLVYET